MKLEVEMLLPSVFFCLEEEYFHWCSAVTVLGSPGCCLWYCFYSLFKGFILVRYSNMEREGRPRY